MSTVQQMKLEDAREHAADMESKWLREKTRADLFALQNCALEEKVQHFIALNPNTEVSIAAAALLRHLGNARLLASKRAF